MMCFYFVTHSYSSYMETIIADLYQRPTDIIIMNSCLWDITRYGKEAVEQQNLIESSYKLTVLQTLIPNMLKSNKTRTSESQNSNGCPFSKDDVLKLFDNKFACVISDSVMRSVYKDLLMRSVYKDLLMRSVYKDLLMMISDDHFSETLWSKVARRTWLHRLPGVVP